MLLSIGRVHRSLHTNNYEMEALQQQPFSLLSKRSEKIRIDLDYVTRYSSWPAVQNQYHETENPKGIINFGTAVSALMDDIWLERLKSLTVYEPSYKHFRYYQFWGHDNFRMKLAQFMTCFFRPRSSINFENLFIINGAMGSVDILGLLLADETDVFLCPTPGYNSYFQAGKHRWNFEVVSVPFDHEVGSVEATFSLSLKKLESILADLKAQGKNVRGFILNNPNNPLGIVLEREIIEQIMRFCQREKMHLIADEMYCMSVYDKSAQFTSVLEIRNDDLLDKDLMHVIWGFSKDLCMTSFRTGVIHTDNREIQLKLKVISQFHAVPLPIMDMLTNIISDIKWFKDYFVPKNLERLKSSHDRAAKMMQLLGIPITKTKAGFFFLADFRSHFNPCTEDKCKEFILKMYENGIYMTPGWEMRAEAGWFRFVFTTCVKDKDLNEGLGRLRKTLEQWKQEQLKEMRKIK